MARNNDREEDWAAVERIKDSLRRRDIEEAGESFGQIMNKYRNPMVAFCTVQLWSYGDIVDIQGVVQDVFVKFYEFIPNFNGRASTRTILIKFSRELCIDIRRTVERRNRLNLEKIFPSHRSVLTRDQEDLIVAIVQLPENQIELLSLHYFANLRIEEIAELYSVHRRTITRRINRAIERLKEIMGL